MQKQVTGKYNQVHQPGVTWSGTEQESFYRLRDMTIGSYLRRYGKLFKIMDAAHNPITTLFVQDVHSLCAKGFIDLRDMDGGAFYCVILKPFL